MISDIIQGLLAFFRSFSAIPRYGLWKYLFLSGFIGLAVGSGISYGIYGVSDDLGQWLASFWRWDIGRSYVLRLSEWASMLFLFFLFLLTFKYIMLIVVSPIMSLMSERIENKLTHGYQASSFSMAQTLSDLWRGVRLSLRNVFKELFLTLLLLLMGFVVPVFAFITTPLVFLIQSYFAGFGNMDYYLERHFDMKNSVAFVKRNKGIAIGNGIGYLLLLLIPVVGMFMAPTLSTISSTLHTHERMENLYPTNL